MIPKQQMEEFRDLLAGFKQDTQEAGMVRALLASEQQWQDEHEKRELAKARRSRTRGQNSKGG